MRSLADYCKEGAMISLSLKGGGFLGTIDEADLQVLLDHLEEETETDTDYYITADTVDMLREDGASAGLVGLLERAVGSSEGVEISWKKS